MNISKYEELPQPHWANCWVTLTGQFFPYVQTVSPVFQFVPIASVSVSGHHRKKSRSSSIHTPFRQSYSLMRFPAEALVLQAGHAQLCAFPHRGDAPVPSLSLQSFARLSIISLTGRAAHNWTQHLRYCITCAGWSGRIASKDLLVALLLMPLRCLQPSLPPGCIAGLSSGVHHALQSLFCKVVFLLVVPQHRLVPGIVSFQLEDFVSPFVLHLVISVSPFLLPV